MENITSPLFLEGWSEFNQYKWRLTPKRERVFSKNNKESFIDYIIYLDHKEKIRMPKLNNYLPMAFSHSVTTKNRNITNQWLDAAEDVVKNISAQGLSNGICFTPNIFDMRIFQWYGYIVEPRYTYFIDFPHDKQQMSNDVRRRINNCIKNNYIFERTNKLSDIYHCLTEPSRRKNINFYLTLNDLKVAAELIGDEHFRAYITYTPKGEPACANILLHYPGCRSQGLLTGTTPEQLASGATQFTFQNVLDDLQKVGATGIDLTGATSREISRYKNDLGAQLATYYMVMQPGLWSMGYQIYRKIFSSKNSTNSSYIHQLKNKLKIAIDRTIVKKII